MSTIKSSDEHLTLNADGSSKDIKFQANGVEKASISSAGAFTSTTIDATKLTGALPAISGAALTGVGVAGITSSADATAMTIDSSEKIGIGTASPLAKLDVSGNNGSGGYVGVIRNDTNSVNYHGLLVSTMYDTLNSTVLHLKTNTANPTTGGSDLLKVTGDGRGLSQFTAKAWVNFNGTGTVAIRDSHNVSSITDNASGDYSINYTNNMANVNYAVVPSSNASGGDAYSGSWGDTDMTQPAVFNMTVSQYRQVSYELGVGYFDCNLLMGIVFGD